MISVAQRAEEFFKQFSKDKRLYIVPTLNGAKLFGLCFILLFTGLIYTNNFIIFFNFLLFSLFICSMFYTHFNLSQIKILRASVESSFVGQKTIIKFLIENESSLPKYMLKLKLAQNDNYSMEELVIPTILPKQSLEINHVITLNKRGHFNLKKIELWTNFPFSFFRAFSFSHLNTHFFSYPNPKKFEFYLDQLPSVMKKDDDSDLDLIPFARGESYRHVHWKKFALTQALLIKKMSKENREDFLIPGDELVNGYSLDDQLSFLTFIISDLMTSDFSFGLKFRDIYFSPDSSLLHRKKMLEALSVVGLD